MTVYPDSINVAQTLLNQQATINEQQAKIKRLQAENDRLRAALVPLAALWRDAYNDKPDDTPVYGLNDVVLRVGDIRAARQALEGER